MSADAGPGTRLACLDLRAAGAEAARDPEFLRLARRGAVPDASVRAGVREILADVRAGGGAAVQLRNRQVGGGLADGRLVIERAELAAAASKLDPDVRAALEVAIRNVWRFAERQRPASTVTAILPGVEIERRWRAVERAGAYVPGGSAAYPSSAVMTVVPARVAGVASIVVASPAGPDGAVNPVLLGVLGLLDVDALIVAGGAQAIAALAFGLPDAGTEPADVVVGPGNAWVTAAKLELAGTTAIDLPAGPSEGMVVATPPADPRLVAADLITQAEHGPDSPAILVTTSAEFADAVEAEVARQVEEAARADMLRRSLGSHGRILLVSDLAAAVAIVNAYGPEHLSIEVEEPEALVRSIRNAGSVFVGPWAPESAGDYATGANHVLPTGGLARGCGPLAVETFGKFSQVQRITREGLEALRPTITMLAAVEGLAAHGRAVELRFEPAPAGAEIRA
ncbi:MAG: histidinol dehydrogenase [Chloroflexi bacterium]|nr:histidinol dehydrogenase [Chloroflexota bacterium]